MDEGWTDLEESDPDDNVLPENCDNNWARDGHKATEDPRYMVHTLFPKRTL